MKNTTVEHEVADATAVVAPKNETASPTEMNNDYNKNMKTKTKSKKPKLTAKNSLAKDKLPIEPTTEAEVAAYEKAAKEFADTKTGQCAIMPTTDARMKFIEFFVPVWMKQFEGDDWQVAFRLMEEADDNFQFKENGRRLDEGLLRKDVSMCHIIVMQQLQILKQRSQISAMRLAAANGYKEPASFLREANL